MTVESVLLAKYRGDGTAVICFVCLFALRPGQQLCSWRDGQFTEPHLFLGKLEQTVNTVLCAHTLTTTLLK